MADSVSIDQALVTLKKGTQLVKYSRKGKPKFRSFRVSPEEKTLYWYSHGDEKSLKLSNVSQILLGQRTICKNQFEVDVSLTGLNSLIATCKSNKRHTQSDISDLQGGGEFLKETFNLPSDVVSERNKNMQQVRTSSVDGGFRISVSSTPSCSSQGSSIQDDIESLGDVYMWGSIWYDVSASSDGSGSATLSSPKRADVLFPKPLESNVVLDVHQISCGVRHVALVTRQGEVFTWGEESGGRLGHGIERDLARPHLVEFLAVTSVDFVACGENHTCAVSNSGDLYSWGNGSLSPGLLGNGSDVSHWIPKRVSGPLEGLQVLSVACGSWHSALVTTNGKVFTFGEGTFGALGHGDRESISFPKEVESLSGLKTIKVSCGVWHTAAIVDVSNQYGSGLMQRKLFTWGDGDKNRLGHGNKDPYLLPTCVSSLIDYNFTQLGCGHNLTVALTSSGHVFTLGSTAYGQLGNPQSDGKLPCLVQDRLVGEFVEEIACGDYHVAVVTSRSELYTWGHGANGRLGHGDVEDRNTPTLVEALRDKHVKSISCGSNYTSTVCVHKWVSGADQSVCSGCRQAFGFTRKRHNCYNCGLVHCHACSSKKALKAALAPTPGKPHRVCDNCYIKLKKAPVLSDVSSVLSHSVRGGSTPPPPRPVETRSSRLLLGPIRKPVVKYVDGKSVKTMGRVSQAPSILQMNALGFSSFSALHNALKPVAAPPSPPPSPPPGQSQLHSAATYNSRPSPTRSSAPAFSRGLIDSLKKTNELLSQEVNKLQNEVKSLRQKSEIQDAEIKKVEKNAQDAARFAAVKSAKFSVTMDVIKCVTTELKEIAEKLPPEISDSESYKAMCSQVESALDYDQNEASELESFPAYMDSIMPNPPGKLYSEFVQRRLYKMEEEGDADSSPSVNNGPHETLESGSRSPRSGKPDGKREVIEQFEPGVYVTLLDLGNGMKVFKRVKFSKRRFGEHQAEEWWKENKERLLKKYSPAKPTVNSNPTESTADALSATDENNDPSTPS